MLQCAFKLVFPKKNPVKTLATAHAPIGGLYLKGKFFRGGEFIPEQYLQHAKPHQKAQFSWKKDLFDPEDWTPPARQRNLLDEMPDDAQDMEVAGPAPDAKLFPVQAKEHARRQLEHAVANHQMTPESYERHHAAVDAFHQHIAGEIEPIKELNRKGGKSNHIAAVRKLVEEHGIDPMSAKVMLERHGGSKGQAVQPATPAAKWPAKAAEEKPKGKAKEPWEMTYEELSKNDDAMRPMFAKHYEAEGNKQMAHRMRTGDTVPTNALSKVHRKEIQDALAAGKPVPPEVLADYPDMAKKAKPAETPEPEAKPTARKIPGPLKKMADGTMGNEFLIVHPDGRQERVIGRNGADAIKRATEKKGEEKAKAESPKPFDLDAINDEISEFIPSDEGEEKAGPEPTVTPSAERHDAIHKELQALYRDPKFAAGDRAAVNKAMDLERELEQHKPAAIERAQKEIDAEKAGKGKFYDTIQRIQNGEATEDDLAYVGGYAQNPMTPKDQKDAIRRARSVGGYSDKNGNASYAEQIANRKVNDESEPTDDKPESSSAPWHGSREHVFEAMRTLDKRVQHEWERAKSLGPRHGSVSVGSADFDHILYGTVGEAYLRALNRGKTPEEALTEAKADGLEAIRKWNSQGVRGRAGMRSKEEMKRWEGAGDSIAENIHRQFVQSVALGEEKPSESVPINSDANAAEPEVKHDETAVAEKIKKLTAIKEANYAAAGDPDPKAAAAFAVEGALNQYRHQKEHLAQLLDEEIEDALKAGEKLKPSEVATKQSESEDEPAEVESSGESQSLARHAIDVGKESIFASGKKRSGFGPPSISMASLKGANEIWHHQGDPDQTRFNAVQSNASDYSKRVAAEIEAAYKAGYKYANYKAGKYGTLWVLEKDGRILTKRGAEALVNGTGSVDLPTGTDRKSAKPIIDEFHSFVESLPESTRENFGALVTAINRSPLGKHVVLSRDEYGHIQLSGKNKNWHVGEPVNGHDKEGNWHRTIESSLPRFLAKISHMAANDIPEGDGEWAVHDRAADAHAVGVIGPNGEKAENKESSPEPKAEPEPKTEEPKATASESPSPDSLSVIEKVDDKGKKGKFVTWPFHHQTAKAIVDGTITHDELKRRFDALTADPEAVKKSIAEALKKTGMRSAAKIASQAREIYDRALGTLTLGASISYMISGNRDAMDKAKMAAYRKAFDAITPESLAEFATKRKEAMAAHDKAMTNPETPEELRRFVDRKGEAALSPEQAAKWDEVQAAQRRERDSRDQTQRAVVSSPTGEGIGYTIHEGFHTKHQKPIHIVKLGTRVDSATFKQLAEAARKLGGNYQQNSKWTRGASPDGFNFDTPEAAERFGKLLSGNSVSRLEDWQEAKGESEQRTAARLKELADRSERSADEQLSRDRLTNTARRANMASSAEASARSAKAFAETTRRVADAIEQGKANHLRGVRAGTHLQALDTALRLAQYARNRKENIPYDQAQGRSPEAADIAFASYPYPYFDKGDLLRFAGKMRDTPGAKRLGERIRKFAEKMGDEGMHVSDPHFLAEIADVAKSPSAYGLDKSQSDTIKYKMDNYMRLQAADIKTPYELRAALREYLPLKEKPKEEDAVKKAERALIGQKIPGFFPTPRPIIDDMVDRADIKPGMKVLEPSAGKGDILDAVRENHPDVETSGVELVHSLSELNRLKGHNVTSQDFMTINLGDDEKPDRIIMNPPFENGQDIDHVRKAYDLLKPGGKLVAIMSESPFANSTSKAAEFRNWLDAHGGTSERMDEGSFAGKDAFRQTGVRTRLVEIAKPAVETPKTLATAFPVPRPVYRLAINGRPVMTLATAPVQPTPVPRKLCWRLR